jgi:hypothetical protein
MGTSTKKVVFDEEADVRVCKPSGHTAPQVSTIAIQTKVGNRGNPQFQKTES